MSGLAITRVQDLGSPARMIAVWCLGVAISLVVAGLLYGTSPWVAAAVLLLVACFGIAESVRVRDCARLSRIQFAARRGFSAVVDGGERHALLVRRVFISPWIVFALLECTTPKRAGFRVALTSSSAGADTFRRLRISLLHGNSDNPP